MAIKIHKNEKVGYMDYNQKQNQERTGGAIAPGRSHLLFYLGLSLAFDPNFSFLLLQTLRGRKSRPWVPDNHGRDLH